MVPTFFLGTPFLTSKYSGKSQVHIPIYSGSHNFFSFWFQLFFPILYGDKNKWAQRGAARHSHGKVIKYSSQNDTVIVIDKMIHTSLQNDPVKLNLIFQRANAPSHAFVSQKLDQKRSLEEY